MFFPSYAKRNKFSGLSLLKNQLRYLIRNLSYSDFRSIYCLIGKSVISGGILWIYNDNLFKIKYSLIKLTFIAVSESAGIISRGAIREIIELILKAQGKWQF